MVRLLLLLVDQPLNVAEFRYMTRDGDGALLIKPVLILGLLQQLHEQRVTEIYDGHHESLLLLPLTHQHSEASFGDALIQRLVLLPVVEVR